MYMFRIGTEIMNIYSTSDWKTMLNYKKFEAHPSCEEKREFQKNICFIDYPKGFDCEDHNKLWKILQDRGISDHLACLLRMLYAGQEGTIRTRHGTTDSFQTGKGVCQGCTLSPLFNFYAEYITWNAGLESRLPGEISITSDMQMIPPLWQKVKN